MSVLYDTILGMEKWYKKDYVCSICDALIEMTTKSDELRDKNCIECYGDLTLLSVVDATISSTEKKEEQIMETTITIAETYNPNLLVTYKKIDGESVTYPTQKVTEIEYALDQSRRNYNALVEKQNAWYKKESQLRTLLEEVFADSSDQDTLEQIADIFDVPLTKEIEVTAWVRVDMTIEVGLVDGDTDLEDLVRNNITIDSFGSEISVNDYDVERVEEGAY
jgi:hypothetical protein